MYSGWNSLVLVMRREPSISLRSFRIATDTARRPGVAMKSAVLKYVLTCDNITPFTTYWYYGVYRNRTDGTYNKYLSPINYLIVFAVRLSIIKIGRRAFPVAGACTGWAKK